MKYLSIWTVCSAQSIWKSTLIILVYIFYVIQTIFINFHELYLRNFVIRSTLLRFILRNIKAVIFITEHSAQNKNFGLKIKKKIHFHNLQTLPNKSKSSNSE